jgi:hypothetical protein
VASPLPPSGAPDAGDHFADGSKAALDLPAVEAALPVMHKQTAVITAAAGEMADKPLPVIEVPDREADHNPVTTAQNAAVATALPAPVSGLPVVTAEQDVVLDTSKAQAIVAVTDHDTGIALSFMAAGGDHVQVSYNDNAYFAGTEKKADTFLIILGGDERELTTKVGNFEQGQDSLVIEKSGDDGTSSAIITDLGALVANGEEQRLTVIGQATVEIHLSAPVHALVSGG